MGRGAAAAEGPHDQAAPALGEEVLGEHEGALGVRREEDEEVQEEHEQVQQRVGEVEEVRGVRGAHGQAASAHCEWERLAGQAAYDQAARELRAPAHLVQAEEGEELEEPGVHVREGQGLCGSAPKGVQEAAQAGEEEHGSAHSVQEEQVEQL